jgi:hypothetical protein
VDVGLMQQLVDSFGLEPELPGALAPLLAERFGRNRVVLVTAGVQRRDLRR